MFEMRRAGTCNMALAYTLDDVVPTRTPMHFRCFLPPGSATKGKLSCACVTALIT